MIALSKTLMKRDHTLTSGLTFNMTEPLEFTAIIAIFKDDKVPLKIGNCSPFYSRDIFPNKGFNGSAWEKE